MVTDRVDDLKSLMHDNATFIQFPPIGSSTSLINVLGEHRVNVQRTIRSIMQLVRGLPFPPLLTLTIPQGVPILRSFIVAFASPIQRSHTIDDFESHSSVCDPQASLLRNGC